MSAPLPDWMVSGCASCTAHTQPRPVRCPPPKKGICGTCGGKRRAWHLLSCCHGEPTRHHDTNAHPPAGQLYPLRRDCATAGVDVRGRRMEVSGGGLLRRWRMRARLSRSGGAAGAHERPSRSGGATGAHERLSMLGSLRRRFAWRLRLTSCGIYDGYSPRCHPEITRCMVNFREQLL